jgi:hypothetical protein
LSIRVVVAGILGAFNQWSQHLTFEELQMGKPKHNRCRRGIRPILGSIGRPQAGLKGERLLFWRAIAKGHSTERSAETAGVSAAVGTRWFRYGGGMPDISLEAPTDRYLTLAEREEIALLKASQRYLKFSDHPD